MYTGRGGYKATQGNILMAGGSGSVPGFQSASDETGALTISHSEYVCDIYGLASDETFHVTAMRLNPGLHATFPWLSQIACNFEEYEMIQLLFTFESKISDQLSGSNGQVGSIIMFTDYGPDSALKTSKYTMLQGYASGDALLTNNLVHGVECDPSKLHGDGHKYIRTSRQDGSLNDYDLGITQIGVTGTPATLANQIVGQLHVSYTVKLMKPRIYSALALATGQDFFSSNGTHTNGAYIFGTDIHEGVDNGIGCECIIQRQGTQVEDGLQGSTDTQLVRLTFPAHFAGPVEIIITTECNSSGDGTTDGNNVQQTLATLRSAPTTNGNVFPINDMSCAFAGFGTDILEDGYYQMSSGIDGRIARFHYNVEMADSGKDNYIEFPLQQISNTAGVDGPINRSVMEVRRYNNRESAKAPSFLDSNGEVVTL